MQNSKEAEKPSKTATNFTEVSIEPTVTHDEQTKHSHRKKFKQNWRINLLALPRNPRGKYTYPPESFDSGVASGALKYEAADRIEHMSRPIIRTLVVNKRQFMPLHQDYEKKMDNRIELSWNSIYNTYKKARRDLARKTSTTSRRSRGSRGSRSTKEARCTKGGKKDLKGKEKGGKGDGKKGKGKKGKKQEPEKKFKSTDKYTVYEKTDEEIEKEIEEWCELRAKPKKVYQPEPIPRGPIADLIELREKMEVLATPKKVHSIETKDPTKIAEAALIYTATERILELARPAPFRLIKDEPYIPGKVKPEALQAIATERIKQLATPKVTQNAHDADLKEDPFAISPNALKYVATERIKELAQPIER